MPYYYYTWDWTYALVLIGVVLSLYASFRVRTTFQRYAKVKSLAGMTGEQAAERILQSAGIYDVTIRHVRGELNDHYDPRNKTLNLSDSVYGSTSVAAVGVAAHECGHAIQHDRGYAPLWLRSVLAPVASFGANISWPLILLGLLISHFGMLVEIGIWMFAIAVAFQVITLPVEFDASRRAVELLGNTGILYSEEVSGARKVLKAAALTYVAAAASAILQLLRLVVLFGNRRRD